MSETKIFIRGMSCRHCKAAVESELMKIEGVVKVNVDLDRQIASISGDELDLNQIKKMIEDIGYHYDGVVN